MVRADSGGTGYVSVKQAAAKKIAPKPRPTVTPAPAAAPSSGGGFAMPGLSGMGGQAASIVDAQLNPKIAALNQGIRQAQTSQTQGIADIGKYFGAAGSTINQSQGSVDKNTANTLAALHNIFGESGHQQQAAYADAQTGVAKELSRLGLKDVIPNSIAPTQADAKFAAALTALQGSNASAVAKEMGTNTSGLIHAIAAEAAASGAQSKTDLKRQMTNVIGNLLSQRDATKASRAGLIQQEEAGLQQAAASQAYKNAQLGISQARLGLSAQNAAGASDSRSLSNALKSAQLQNLLNPKGSNKGVGAAYSFLKSTGLNPTQVNSYGHLIDLASGQPHYSDAIAYINDQANAQKFTSNLKNALLRATAIAWGKY